MNSPGQCAPAALYWSKCERATGHKFQLLPSITFLFPVYFVCALHLANMYILSWQTEERGGAHGRTFLHKSVNTYTADRQNTWRTRGLSEVALTHTINDTHPLATLHRLACWQSRVIVFFFLRQRIQSARKLMVVISQVGPQFVQRSTWHTPSVSGKSPNESHSPWISLLINVGPKEMNHSASSLVTFWSTNP